MRIKNIIIVLGIFALPLSSFSQTTLSVKDLVSNINWEWTEAQFVYAFHPFIEPIEHDEWSAEKADFGLKNISIGDRIVESSVLRVSKSSNKLIRVGLNVIKEGKDIDEINKLISVLIRDFGEPTKKSEERSQVTNFITTEMYWETYDYTIRTHHWNTIKSHLFSIAIEPPR